MTDDDFKPGHPAWCSVGKPPDEPHLHCSHWDDCEPCCRCGDDTPDPNCDCERCAAVRTTSAMTVFTEITHDPFGALETRWECRPPPALDVPFVVEYQTWNDDYTIRTIHRIRLVGAEPATAHTAAPTAHTAAPTAPQTVQTPTHSPDTQETP